MKTNSLLEGQVCWHQDQARGCLGDTDEETEEIPKNTDDQRELLIIVEVIK